MAQMSTKEAKRRGLMPRSATATGRSAMYGDNLNLNLSNRMQEPINAGSIEFVVTYEDILDGQRFFDLNLDTFIPMQKPGFQSMKKGGDLNP